MGHPEPPFVPHGASGGPPGFRPAPIVPTVQTAVSPPARILVVEDDSAVRETVVELLEEEGYSVAEASNGAEALQVLASGAAPGLIVLDLMMPVMDGWTFRAEMRRDPRLAQVPVLVMSAGHGNDEQNLARIEPNAFLAKPFDVCELVETVHRLC